MYEESTHVPLAFKLPGGRTSGKRSGELVSHIDVLPTLCDLLDVPPPPGVQGVSLRGAIERGASIDREHIFIQFDGNGARGNFQRCLVGGPHKLIVDIFKDETFFELYDTVRDPQEKVNLAFDEGDRAREMIDILLDIMRDTGDLIAFSPDDYDRFLQDYAPFQAEGPYYPLGRD